jgi:hypothetical protein
MMSRPLGTARDPVYIFVKQYKRGRTGGQKSFCMSITSKADVLGLNGGMLAEGGDREYGDDPSHEEVEAPLDTFGESN